MPFPHSDKPFIGKLSSGWKVNSIVVWQSGFPLTVLSGVDNSFTGIALDHANYRGGVALPTDRSHAAMVSKFFDTTRFAMNPVGTFGTASKGIATWAVCQNRDSGKDEVKVKEAEKVDLEGRCSQEAA